MTQIDVKKEYFESAKTSSCQKCIAEPENQREWFYEDGKWCFFKRDFGEYRLVCDAQKDFSSNCFVKDLKEENCLLLYFYKLRKAVTIDKVDFSNYAARYKKEAELQPHLTLESFNKILREKETEALKRADKITNIFFATLLCAALFIFVLFLITTLI